MEVKGKVNSCLSLLKLENGVEAGFNATNLIISTCTVLTNLNVKINLGYFTRFVNVFEQQAPELELKNGGIYNIEYYGNCARGETLLDRIKDEFNNQTTIMFKYWGFRNINIKVFANGRLQITGLKYENEATDIGTLLIDIIKGIRIKVLSNISELANNEKTFNYQVVYNPQTNKVSYYRKNYIRFLDCYNFNIDECYTAQQILPINNNITTQSNTSNTSTTDNTLTNENKQSAPVKTRCRKRGNDIINIKNFNVNIKRKGFIKGVHDVYDDVLDEQNKDFLKQNNLFSDNEIMLIIDKFEMVKTLFDEDMNVLLSNSKNFNELHNNLLLLGKKYQDFKFEEINIIITDLEKGVYSNDEQTLMNVKDSVFQIRKIYFNLVEKKINRLLTIRTIDINICNDLNTYVSKIISQATLKNPSFNLNNPADINNILDTIKDVSLDDIEVAITNIDTPTSYFIDKTETVLINSDFTVNFNINLKKLSKILKKKGLFNTYEPDEHSGINLKYYYNTNNITQGFCNCLSHCATKEKKSNCTKITILIFRPGSIIITGSRNLEQLKSAHKLILKLVEENMDTIKMDETPDENKHIAILNNEFRKISRKARLFYIKKQNIVYPGSTVSNTQ